MPYGSGKCPPRHRIATPVGLVSNEDWSDPPKRRPLQTEPDKRKCSCPMGAALRSVRRGKFRLARRYAAWSARLIMARFAA